MRHQKALLFKTKSKTLAFPNCAESWKALKEKPSTISKYAAPSTTAKWVAEWFKKEGKKEIKTTAAKLIVKEIFKIVAREGTHDIFSESLGEKVNEHKNHINDALSDTLNSMPLWGAPLKVDTKLRNKKK